MNVARCTHNFDHLTCCLRSGFVQVQLYSIPVPWTNLKLTVFNINNSSKMISTLATSDPFKTLHSSITILFCWGKGGFPALIWWMSYSCQIFDRPACQYLFDGLTLAIKLPRRWNSNLQRICFHCFRPTNRNFLPPLVDRNRHAVIRG